MAEHKNKEKDVKEKPEVGSEDTKEEVTEGAAEEKAEEKALDAPKNEPDEKDKTIEALKDKILRISAEYDNFRKRTQREKDALYGDAKADTVAQFLPLLDNIEKAVKTMPEAKEKEWQAVSDGVALIKKQFEETLKKLGVNEINALGETFDPELHNAVMHVEDSEVGEGIVVEEFQKGFKINDKVVRHSVVKVAN